LLKFFPNNWTLTPFQWDCYLSSYCEFVLRSDLETRSCKRSSIIQLLMW